MTRSQQSQDIVPPFQSIQEMAEFWDTHDSTDFEDHWQPVEIDIARPLGRVVILALDLSDEEFVRLRTAAAELGMSADDLVKRWVHEQLARQSRDSAAD